LVAVMDVNKWMSSDEGINVSGSAFSCAGRWINGCSLNCCVGGGSAKATVAGRTMKLHANK
ncbi:hypothetical protein, partial [Gilliamella apicola]|uniref:hypothetical protein n=1 Tax=Gilliamella apicola TaxID=1196095 RepID=UPI0015E8DE54